MRMKNSNIELLRVISMIMVVVLHTLAQGGFLKNSIVLTSKYNALWFIEISAYCAVNIFALITGYVSVHSTKWKFKNLISIWTQVLFYSIMILGLISLLCPSLINYKVVIKSFVPVLTNQYWYVTAYVGVFFLAPYLNKILKSCTLGEMKQLIAMLMILFSFIPTITKSDVFLTNNGYSVWWLAILYLVGGYIRLNEKEIKKNITLKKASYIYLSTTIFLLVFRILIEGITLKFLGVARGGSFLLGYQSPFIVLSGVSLFIGVLNLEINEKFAKVILKISPLVFGVYLIHTQSIFFNNIWSKLFIPFNQGNLIESVFTLIISILIVFALSLPVEYLRQLIFKKLKLNEYIFSLLEKIFGFKNKFNLSMKNKI